ncbi:MAG: hypothetical protein IJH22_06945, partial [Firmicutes bacterium]|nr:hypothetical protein [Bacillota bacterium]
KGVVTDISGRTLTLDSGKTFNVAGAKLDVSGDEALGQTVVVEYKEGSDSAIHVYLADGSKAIGAEDSSGGGSASTIAIILALIAIAIAVVIVIIRNRRKAA